MKTKREGSLANTLMNPHRQAGRTQISRACQCQWRCRYGFNTWVPFKLLSITQN